jgi:catechol 2,3-dioxygenase-like lactoylglutathione lyase family enzyme
MAEFRSDHLHLRSTDPEGAARFYTEMLGAKRTGELMSGNALRVMLNLGGLNLFLEEVPPGTPSTPKPPFLGIEHVGLAVTGFDAAVAELKAKGVVFVKEPSSPRPGVKIAFIQAPDGVQIEILERTAE